MLHLSGQIALPPGASELVGRGLSAETRQTPEHIRRMVARHGSPMARIVQRTVFPADVSAWTAMHRIYVSFSAPTRVSPVVTGLALGARTEIECLAVVDDSSHDAGLDS